MNYEFSLFHRNFVMAVSYGVTFAVMVVFLFIAFTGYLEVNKPRRAVFNTYQQVIRLLSTVQVSVSVVLQMKRKHAYVHLRYERSRFRVDRRLQRNTQELLHI